MSNKTKLCVECGERPILNKKRQLCGRCYQRIRRQGSIPLMKERLEHTLCPATQRNREIDREMAFVKAYFKHDNWAYQPANFHLNGTDYMPDFYDRETDIWIEVSGSRQAYHQNKKKYQLFRALFPGLKLEIRHPSGKLLNEEGKEKNWEQ